MRVALLSMSCRDGSVEHVARLASCLAPVVETHLFMPAHPDLETSLAGEVLHHPIGAMRPLGAAWRKVLAMGNPWLHAERAKRIRRISPDLVHLVHPHPTHAMLIPLLGLPTCLSLQSSEIPATERDGSLREFMIGRSLAMVDQLLLHDPGTAESLQRHGLPSDRLAILPPALDASALLAAYRQMLVRLQTPPGFPAAPA